MELLDLFFAVMLKSSKVKVRVPLMLLDLIIQIPRFFPLQDPLLQFDLGIYFHLSLFEEHRICCLTLFNYDRIQKSKFRQVLFRVFEVVQKLDEIAGFFAF